MLTLKKQKKKQITMKIKFVKSDKSLICIKEPVMEGDVGYDIYASTDTTIFANQSGSIPTGLFLELPKGYWFEIMPKSGLAKKYSIAAHNGVIDNGYRGEVIIYVYNHGKEDYTFKKNEKISQGVLRKSHILKLEEVDKLSMTNRGSNGFGSTGK